ncbi:probable G-protein coupled receptor 158 isoform X2 [Sitodiplosis mosellana]|uniref:probable G-protein coupled receptor 158 isoform X2 n=1 Tax=Sitodiplosis mosellana TaxID=263140 RepID=UPI0024447682|nr:probable G-protein coupled receptor 158 isoform X2 [Sitodiplosis mosellana]
MVGFAKDHHPSNCLPLNNRNRFGDDGNVASGAAAAKTKESTTFYTDDVIIDSVVGDGGDDENGPSNCEHWHRQKRRSQKSIINDNIVEPNNCRRHRRHRSRVNVQIYHGNRKKTIQGAAKMWFRIQSTVVKSCNLSMSVVFCAAISLLLLNIDVITAEPQQQTTEQRCEPKVLEETPPDPFYDAYDITIEAAKKLADYLNSIRPVHIITPEIRSQANAIATESLQEDEGLLAIAIAAPSLKLAVVQFRDIIDIAPEVSNNHTYLRTYWRELGLAWNHTEGAQFWGPPFRDCGALRGRWLWPFSVNFQANGIKTVASTFIAADDDPCNDALEPIFGKKHSCDTETTFCFKSLSNDTTSGGVGGGVNAVGGNTILNAFKQRSSYTCLCNFGYYVPNQTLQGFEGQDVESNAGNYTCIRCPGGCAHCNEKGECSDGEPQEYYLTETLLRFSIGVILGSCMFSCLILAIIVFRQRKCKTISSGMWTVLEIILLGILLMYSSVGLHFFPASTVRCLLEPWFRELGFIVCYGAIILKLYRHLVEFRTRKAHRWVLRDIDLLKYLSSMIFAVVCYMSAFTASSMDLIQTAALEGLQEVQTNTCQQMKWEFVTQFSEILILAFGLHLAIASRNANTQFRERQFLVASISAEFIVSVNFYILRAIYLNSWGPGTIFLILFLRSQFTNTITMGLIFLPKLWYQHKQGAHDASHHGGAYAGIYIGDPDIGELTISEMSPEDIRAELKRLYTQLEVLKNKTLRQDNPHISKRRGGRKPAHRRFSLQALSAKHRSHRHHAQDTEMTEAEPSRTPEDSVCSVEGPTETGGEPSALSTSKVTSGIYN